MAQPVLESSDWSVASSVDEVRALLGRSFSECELEPTAEAEPVAVRRRAFGSSSIIEVSYGGWKFEKSPAPGDFFTECFIARGVSAIGYGEHIERCSPGARAIVISTLEPVSLHVGSNTLMVAIRVERDSLHEHLSQLTGRSVRGTLELEAGVDAGRGNGAARRRLIETAMQGDPVNFSFGAAFEDAYLTALLTGQLHSHSHLLEERAPEGGHAAVRRVEDFIYAHPEQPLRSETLVAVSGICSSSLYEAFKHCLGTTPMRLLREVRLLRIREDLLRPEAETTVTSVALDWGVSHLARFGGCYARRFGELPSETLAKARRRAT